MLAFTWLMILNHPYHWDSTTENKQIYLAQNSTFYFGVYSTVHSWDGLHGSIVVL